MVFFPFLYVVSVHQLKSATGINKIKSHGYCVAVHTSLKSIHEVLTLERERLRQAWTGPDLRQSTSQQLATLCSTMSEVTHKAEKTKFNQSWFLTSKPDLVFYNTLLL